MKWSRRAWAGFAVIAGALIHAFGPVHADSPAAATNAPSAASSVTANRDQLLKQANQDAIHGKFDDAIREASQVIDLNLNDTAGYELRAAIYLHKKFWDNAERDYETADKVAPDSAYKYKIAEIEFMRRNYDDARPRFAALQSDEGLGDLAQYWVFICDLLGSHEAIAARDLALIDKNQKSPSHIYAHAAQLLFTGNRPEALKLFAVGEKQFGKTVADRYTLAIIEARDFSPELADFTTKDGRKFTHARVFLESGGLRALGDDGWVTLPIDQLPDDLSGFPDDVREAITDKRHRTVPATAPEPLISFTTKSGKSYRNVRWSIEDDGLSVLTQDGWRTIPFADLPANTSSLPKELAAKLQQSETATPTSMAFVSFTTRDGRHYDNVRAQPSEEGLRVLTEVGWVAIPGPNLPADLSPFPVEWRDKLRATATTHEPIRSTVVTFTSKAGKYYDDVRATMADTGLRLVTSEGLVSVPWKQLPDDLSVFPTEWRTKIEAGKKITPETVSSAASPR